MFQKLRQDKEFLRQFIAITLPIAGQNLILFAVSMADTVMVGQLGEVQLSAVQLANQLGFFLSIIIFGICGGANVMIAQYWGKRDVEGIHRIMAVMYRILIVIAVAFTVVGVGFSDAFMRIFSNNEAVITEGATFLHIVGIGYIATAFANASMLVLRSVSNVKVSLAVYMASLLTNVFFNWIFIFGNLGAPALGVAGAAVATVIARLVELFLAVGYLLFREKEIQYRVRYTFVRLGGFVREFFKNATPIMLNETLWALGMMVVAAIVGRMGTEFTAAYSICMVLGQLVTVAIMGAGNASAVITGNTVGAGEYELAKVRARMLFFISVILGIVSMGAMLLLRTPFVALYEISDTTRELARQFMSIHAGIVFCQSISMVAIIGVLRGGGDGKFAAIMDVIPTWLFAIPLGFLAGHVLGWPAPAVFMMVKVDEPVKPLIATPRLLKGNWVKDLTRKAD